tara:strand:- start:1645 stop:2151 length:507 start_codon:yes stop_codon:yes gene_type:complete
MPKVGKMKFPYTSQGMKEAASYAKNSGRPMQIEGSYRGGGMVPKYQGGGMVPNRPNRMRGPGVPLRRSASRPPGAGMMPPSNHGLRMKPRIDNTVSIDIAPQTDTITLPGGKGEVDIGGVVMPDSRRPIPGMRPGMMRQSMHPRDVANRVSNFRKKLMKLIQSGRGLG